MSEEIFKILFEEFKRNGVKLIEHDFRGDVFISDPADIIHETFERQCTTIPQLLDFSEHDKVFEDKIENLEKQIKIYESHKKVLRNRCMESARDNFDKGVYGCLSIVSYPKEIENENKALKQRIAELESELEKKECIKTMRIEFHADNGEMLTPLEAANSLISINIFKVDELKELAEFLQVYCRHHNDRDTETISF